VLVNIARGYRAAQALCVVARLGIADLLSDGPKPSEVLAQATGTHAPSLYRLLRAVASLGVFAEDEQGRFQLTPLAEPLRSDVPGSVRTLVSFFGEPYFWEAWGDLQYSVRTGKAAFDHVYGMGLYAYLAERPEVAAAFDAGMMAGTREIPLVDAYDFAGVSSVVDVGGGLGTLVAAVLRAHPALRGVLFDQPQVVAGAHAYLEAEGVADRCQVIGGDFFAEVPGGGDAYLLSDVLHNWDDEHAIAILANCRRAMHPNGRLLVVEKVMPAGNVPSTTALIDLSSLVMTGGCERTEAQHRANFSAAGFTLTRIIPTSYGPSVIEGVPA
jgi:hypothetical protein